MIVDTLANADVYTRLTARMAAAFQFLTLPSTIELEPPDLGPAHSLRVDICTDKVFALVQRYQCKSSEQAFWEAHRRYIDVQYIAQGVEMLGYAPLDSMRVVTDYDDQKDFLVLTPLAHAPLQWITLRAGMFAIFMPHDAHMPGLAAHGTAADVKKIVVKVAVDD